MNRDAAFKELWSYLSVKDKLEKSDVIFILGRDDFNIADTAVELYKKGLAPLILLTGGRGRLTNSIIGSESSAFAEYLQAKGVTTSHLLQEEKSTNTGENLSEGLRTLGDAGISIQRAILVTHGPHMRRALAVAKKHGGAIEWLGAPDSCSLTSYENELSVAKELMDEMNRLDEYPRLGYFAPQDTPAKTLSAKKIVEEFIAMS